jgi:rSAM/selenodomain-associated transferase 2
MLSVIVPIYNEEAALPDFLDMASQWDCDCELLFSDGGSADGTLDLLAGRRVVTGAKGRGAQCRLAANQALGQAIVFVHVDSSVPPESMRAIHDAVEAGAGWGCLTLRFTTSTLDRKIGAWWSNARVRCSGIAFGDQVMFMTRELYDQVGGMPAISLMEDYELSRRLRAVMRPKQLPQRTYASPRKFEQGGNLRTMLLMWRLRRMYRRGASPDELAAIYYGRDIALRAASKTQDGRERRG